LNKQKRIFSRMFFHTGLILITLFIAIAPTSAQDCALQPPEAIGLVGTVYSVTATLTDGGSPLAGILIDFQVTAGPHSGTSASEVTDASGQAFFSYSGVSSGTDTIVADGTALGNPFSCSAEIIWSTTSLVSAFLQDELLIDVDSDGRTGGGDTLRYVLTLTNNSSIGLTGVEIRNLLDANTEYVPGSLQISPIAFPDEYQATGNVNLSVGTASGVLSNDIDPDGDPITIVDYESVSLLGAVVSMATDGSFEYIPPAGLKNTKDVFAYEVSDIAGVTNSGRVTIDISNLIWFVDNTGPNGDGTFDSPFNNLADAETVSGTGDIIFLYEGSGTAGQDSGITLKNNQQLIGQGVDLVVGGNLLVPSANAPVITSSGGDGIGLASGNSIKGLTIDAPSGNGISGSSITDATIGNVMIQDSGAKGISFSSGNGEFNFYNLTITGSGDDSVHLNGGAGDYTFSDLDIQSAAGNGLVASGVTLNIASGSIQVLDGSALDVSGAAFDATLTSLIANNSSGSGIILNNNTGGVDIAGLSITNTGGAGLFAGNAGTLNISGSVNGITTTGESAIDIDNTTIDLEFATLASSNSGASGLNLNSTSGSLTVGNWTTVENAAGIGIHISNVSGAGSVVDLGDINITSRNASGIFLSSVDGTIQLGNVNIPNPNNAGGYGLRIDNSSADVTVSSVAISDSRQTVAESLSPGPGINTDIPVNDGDGDGIFLSNNTGSFTLTGGTISLPEGEGIDARNCSAITISDVTVTNPLGNGIWGINLSGTGLLSNLAVDGFNTVNKDGLQLYNTTTNLDMTVDGCTFRNSSTSRNGILVEPRGSTQVTLTIRNNSLFENLLGNAVLGSVGAIAGDTGTLNLTIQDSVFQNAVSTNGQCGIDVASGESTTANITIEDNVLTNVMRLAGFSGAINLRPGGASSMTGTVNRNDIDDSNRQGIGLVASGLGGTSFNLVFDSNTIDDCGYEGIRIRLDETASGVARITNNLIGTISPVGNSSTTRDGMELRARDDTGDFYVLLESNQVIVDSPSGKALDLDVEGNGTIYAHVLGGNIFTNTSGGADFDAETENSGSTLCLKLTGQTSGTFDLTETAGDFRVESLATVAADNPGAVINVGVGVENSPGCPVIPAGP
jgi:uncharacterized repeat protein (TIGR01451 family)